MFTQSCFDVEMTAPATVIFNSIVSSKKYPSQWKIEYAVPIPKCGTSPASLDNLRIVSKTNFLSKVLEGFIIDWLMPYISPFLDQNQFGGLKGISTNHYLIKLLDFTHSVLDSKKPKAVLAAMIDLSKAFNRCEHSKLI